jgi:hypothetical protein
MASETPPKQTSAIRSSFSRTTLPFSPDDTQRPGDHAGAIRKAKAVYGGHSGTRAQLAGPESITTVKSWIPGSRLRRAPE